MRTAAALTFCLLAGAALAANPECAAVPDGCPDGKTTCTYERTCSGGEALKLCTIVRQTIYVQDCTFDPRPRYCPPDSRAAPATIVRHRKIACPNPLDVD